MGWKIGVPSLKLNNAGVTSKHCGDFGSVAREALEEREGHDPDINKEMAERNRFEGFRTAKELQEYSEKHVAQLRDARGRKLRKDAVVMCATILKPPAAMMNKLSPEDQARFLDDANQAFADIVGPENIKSRADHYDELGSHSHVFWEPMTEDGRLCAKEVHNLQFFGRVNRELPQKLRECGWEIEDCECYDAAKEQYEEIQKKNGRDSMTFKVEAEQRKAELEKEIEVLEKEKEDAEGDAGDARERSMAEDARAAEAAEKAAKAEEELRAAQERLAALQTPEQIRQIQGKKSLSGKVTYTSEASRLLERYAQESANVLMRNRDLEEQLDTTAAELVRTQQALKDVQGKLFDMRIRYGEVEKERQTLAKYKAQVEKFLEQFKLVEQFKAWIQKMTHVITR